MNDVKEKAIGNTIKALREATGMSVHRMGTEFGIAYATIKNLETGKVNGITLYTIIRLAKGFKMEPEELVKKILSN